MTYILLLNIVSAFILIGLILTIQFVHYPSFRYVSNRQFEEFHRFHSKRISFVVIPLMLVELVSSLILYFNNQDNMISTVFLINLILVVSIWALTFLGIVPIHNQLAKAFDILTFKKLLLFNFFRTILWISRGLLMIILLGFLFEII